MSHGSPAKNIRLGDEVEEGTFSRGEAMRGICEQACSVANATGAAIALMKAGGLVYEAGSGTAAGSVGRRMMATFIVPASDQAVSEILRVQDAEADSGIPSAICRQFGARSLLILPISSDGILTGILQISFDQPHDFLNAEVEAYRTLARLAEQAMTAPLPSEAANTGSTTDSSSQAFIPEIAEFPFSGEAAAPWSRTRVLSRFGYAWDFAVAAVIVIASVGLVLTRDRATPSLPQSAASPAFRAVPQQPAGDSPASQSSSDRLSENPVMPSVQLRRHQHPAQPTDQVRYFGDDVTVRYFAPKAAVVRTREDVTVQRVLDDVTVRYFPSGAAQKQ